MSPQLLGLGMLKYEYINKEWIVSRTARRVYRGAAALSVALFLGLLAAALEGGIPESIAPIARLFLLAGVLGYATTMAGMEYFLFRFDNSHPLKQIFWFCVMVLPFLGPALYCFIVYSRSDVLKSSCAKPA
jgi:hypothetical protein